MKADKTIKERVLYILENTNSATRTELCQLTGFTDRQIRCAIEELRCEGYPIGKPASGKGYIYGDSAAVDRSIAEGFSRIAAEYRKIRGLQGRPIEGQVDLSEVLI